MFMLKCERAVSCVLRSVRINVINFHHQFCFDNSNEHALKLYDYNCETIIQFSEQIARSS